MPQFGAPKSSQSFVEVVKIAILSKFEEPKFEFLWIIINSPSEIVQIFILANSKRENFNSDLNFGFWVKIRSFFKSSKFWFGKGRYEWKFCKFTAWFRVKLLNLPESAMNGNSQPITEVNHDSIKCKKLLSSVNFPWTWIHRSTMLHIFSKCEVNVKI